MKFCKQKYNNDCGPTVIINALKWVGYNVSQKRHLKKFTKECRYNKKYGIYAWNLNSVLKTYIPNIQAAQKLSLDTINQSLKVGQAVVFCIFSSSKSGHAVLVHKRTPKYYYIVNPMYFFRLSGYTASNFKCKTIRKISISQMEKALASQNLYSRKDDHLNWIIEKGTYKNARKELERK